MMNANVYREQGDHARAESLYSRSLTIRKQQLGSNHPYVAQSLNNIAKLRHIQGRYVDAEILYRQSLNIYEQKLGVAHQITQRVQKNLEELLAIVSNQ
ncbi:tetratricopeptide repeat protein [uncultured Nostoc sp.]|uniref:tetratricopeptide repeat protein n=1 Tax=uncultured Nostoc sp. TaxID=340711 RepID=UPI0035C9E862